MMNLDSYILNKFFDMLNTMNSNYCVMNNYEDLPDIIPSDVDFAIDFETYSKLDSLIIKLANENSIDITQKIWHGYYKCAYILSPINTDKFFRLQLDFFVDFSGRGFPNLLPNKSMLYGKRKYKNFYIPAAEVEVPFLLQRRIFKKDIKIDHINTLNKIYNNNKITVKNNVIKVFGANEGISLLNVIESQDIDYFYNNYASYKAALKRISSSNTNIVYKIKYAFWQLIRAFYRIWYPTGLSIAIVGNDKFINKFIINELNKIVSGSFHGYEIIECSEIFNYLTTTFKRTFLLKITKKVAYLNISNNSNYLYRLLTKENRMVLGKIFTPTPDIVFNIKTTVKDNNTDLQGYLIKSQGENFIINKEYSIDEINTIISKLSFTILQIQSERTKRHLLNKFSPTAHIER